MSWILNDFLEHRLGNDDGTVIDRIENEIDERTWLFWKWEAENLKDSMYEDVINLVERIRARL